VLVTYGSKHGATAEIAETVADELRARGQSADCLPAGEVRNLDGYDAFVIGSAVYMKRWRSDARRLLKRQAKTLGMRPLWIFSSGPCGDKPDPSWSEPRSVVSQATSLHARDHVVFGGRLPLEPGNFMERAMVDACPPEQRDLRDWDEIRGWAAKIAAELAEQSTCTAPAR
jgi:menaquinone-dependent protoporphyrinogen oxidase